MKPPPTALAATFNYAKMAGDDAEWLKRKTERLRVGMTAVAAAIVKIGLELLAVKERLEVGTFRAWCQSELPWSASKVKRFIRVARVFGEAKEIDRFSPSALYVLCWPSVPQPARQAAFELVEAGETVTHSKARELIELHTPRLPADEDDDPPALMNRISPAADRGHSIDERNWADFLEVLGEYGMVHISKHEDEENGTVDYSVTGYPNDDSKGIVRVNRSEIGDALAALLGSERTKECPWCGPKRGPIPVGKFCLNQSEKDGRNRVCRDCESERRRKGRAAAKAKREQQPVPA